MPSSKPRIVARVENKIFNKFQFIANQEKRTLSKQGEYVIEQFIEHYEKEHGEIILEEEND